LQNTNWI